MNDTLQLSDDLALPLDAITQTFAVLAKRGSGKTYTALVMAEEMLRLGLPFVFVDPVGVAWGLRASADGQRAGLPIAVLGGDHADLQIAPEQGSEVAQFVVEERASIVLDLSSFSGSEMTRFITNFAETLYHKNRLPLHLFLDEADTFSPQKPLPGEQRMLGAIDKVVRRGRARGLGITLISQRPAVIHKNVLTQIEVLIALRIVSPQDRKAIESWIEVHGTPEQRDELMSSLPSLPQGEGWIWSPGWLNVFQRIKVRSRLTFDSSATPTMSVAAIEPDKLATVDLSKLQLRLSAQPIQTKAEKADTKAIAILQQRIVELETELQSRPQEHESKLFQDGEVQRLEAAVESLLDFGNRAVTVAQEIRDRLEAAQTLPKPSPKKQLKQASPPAKLGLKAGELKMLKAIARCHPQPLTRVQIGTLSDFAPTGGTFGTYFSNLKRQGLIAEQNGKIQITSSGLKLSGLDNLPPQTPEDRVQMWFSVLKAGERKMLNELLRNSKGLTRAQLAERTGYESSGGTFGTYLSTLRRNDLIVTTANSIRAASWLTTTSVRST